MSEIRQQQTTVICLYRRSDGYASWVARMYQQCIQRRKSVIYNPGQMVEITTDVPPAGFQSQPTPGDMQRASIESTDLPTLRYGDRV